MSISYFYSYFIFHFPLFPSLLARIVVFLHECHWLVDCGDEKGLVCSMFHCLRALSLARLPGGYHACLPLVDSIAPELRSSLFTIVPYLLPPSTEAAYRARHVQSKVFQIPVIMSKSALNRLAKSPILDDAPIHFSRICMVAQWLTPASWW